jgi:hypothetical protein
MNPTARVHMQVALPAAFLAASIAGLSAHVVRGVDNPTLATAFVSSPAGGADAPVRVAWGGTDTKVRIVCFHAANTSPLRADDADSPRVTAVGFELPGSPRGFTLIEPLGTDWQIVEGAQATLPGGQTLTLDFAVTTHANGTDWQHPSAVPHAGIPPGQAQARGSGPRFCVSGPFPDTLPSPSVPGETVATTIESILNGVVVRFSRVTAHGQAGDLGLWDNAQRTVPLYPE